MCFFFFSSRRRHTRWTGDWSADVCSSDLEAVFDVGLALTLFPDDRERGCASHGCGVRATSPGPDAWTPVPLAAAPFGTGVPHSWLYAYIGASNRKPPEPR